MPASEVHQKPTPVWLLRALLVYLDILQSELESIWFQTYYECAELGSDEGFESAVAHYNRVISYVNELEDIALEMFGIAEAASSDPDWVEPEWFNEFRDLQELLTLEKADAYHVVEQIRQCFNPLGVAEDDVPVFFGDVYGDNSRYFASSDYLLNSWAKPAVEQVVGSVEQYRTAWLSRRDRDQRQAELEFEKERRLAAMQLDYSNRVRGLCGDGYRGGSPLVVPSPDEDDVCGVANTTFDPPVTEEDPDPEPKSCSLLLPEFIESVREQSAQLTADAAEESACTGDYLATARENLLLAAAYGNVGIPFEIKILRGPQDAYGLKDYIVNEAAQDVINSAGTPYAGHDKAMSDWRWGESLSYNCDDGEAYDSFYRCASDDADLVKDVRDYVTSGGADEDALADINAALDALSYNEDCDVQFDLGGAVPVRVLKKDWFTASLHYDYADLANGLFCGSTSERYARDGVYSSDSFFYDPGKNLCRCDEMFGFTDQGEVAHDGVGCTAAGFYGLSLDSTRPRPAVLSLRARRLQQQLLVMMGAPLAQIDVPPLPNEETLATCYVGDAGAAEANAIRELSVLYAAAARSAIETQQVGLGLMQCTQLVYTAQLRDELIEENYAAMTSLQGALAGIQAAIAVSGLISTFAGYENSGPLGVARGAASGVAAAMNDGVTNAMSAVSTASARATSRLGNSSDVVLCYAGVSEALERLALSAIAVESARIRVANALQRRDQLISGAKRAVTEGNIFLELEANRVVPTRTHHMWVDERKERFENDFAWAQRVSYLSAKAIEFEMQQSLAVRDDILEAELPYELQDAVNEMEREQASRTLNRARPQENTEVLSLRDDILPQALLRLTEQGEFEEDEQFELRNRKTKVEKLQEMLTHNVFARYDEYNNHIGQGIPFSIHPKGELVQRCGERLWTVSVSVQGDGLNTSAPVVPINMLKENVFSSQWCDGHGDGTPLQTAGIRPTANLFRDRGESTNEGKSQQFSWAKLEPYINVPRSEFYREGYAEGATDEFAGRGLYGNYILLFPKEGLLDEGFHLQGVEDVLIRFDYLSVANGGELTSQ